MRRTFVLAFALMSVPVSLIWAADGFVPIAVAAAPATLKVQVVDADGLPVRDAAVEVRTAKRSPGPIRFPWNMGMGQKNQQFLPGTLFVAERNTVAFPNLDNMRFPAGTARVTVWHPQLHGMENESTSSLAVTGTGQTHKLKVALR